MADVIYGAPAGLRRPVPQETEEQRRQRLFGKGGALTSDILAPRPTDAGYQDDESSKALKLGMAQMQATGLGIRAGVRGLVGDEAGAMRDADRAVQVGQAAAANGPRVGKIEDVRGIGDAAEYARNTLLTQGPQFAATLVGSVSGAGLGLRVAGGVAGRQAMAAAAKRAAAMSGDDAIAAATKLSGVVPATEAIAKQRIAAAAAQKAVPTAKAAAHAQQLGAALGGSVNSVGMEFGQLAPQAINPGDDADTGGAGMQERLLKVTAGSMLAGGIDAFPAFKLLKRTGAMGGLAEKEVSKMAQTMMGRVVSYAGKQSFEEAGTELVQTIIERASAKWVDKNINMLTPEALSEYLNSTVAGATIGLVAGGLSGFSPLPKSVKEAMEKKRAEANKAPLDENRSIAADVARNEESLRSAQEANDEDLIFGDGEAAQDPSYDPNDPEYEESNPLQEAIFSKLSSQPISQERYYELAKEAGITSRTLALLSNPNTTGRVRERIIEAIDDRMLELDNERGDSAETKKQKIQAKLEKVLGSDVPFAVSALQKLFASGNTSRLDTMSEEDEALGGRVDSPRSEKEWTPDMPLTSATTRLKGNSLDDNEMRAIKALDAHFDNSGTGLQAIRGQSLKKQLVERFTGLADNDEAENTRRSFDEGQGGGVGGDASAFKGIARSAQTPRWNSDRALRSSLKDLERAGSPEAKSALASLDAAVAKATAPFVKGTADVQKNRDDAATVAYHRELSKLKKESPELYKQVMGRLSIEYGIADQSIEDRKTGLLIHTAISRHAEDEHSPAADVRIVTADGSEKVVDMPRLISRIRSLSGQATEREEDTNEVIINSKFMDQLSEAFAKSVEILNSNVFSDGRIPKGVLNRPNMQLYVNSKTGRVITVRNLASYAKAKSSGYQFAFDNTLTDGGLEFDPKTGEILNLKMQRDETALINKQQREFDNEGTQELSGREEGGDTRVPGGDTFTAGSKAKQDVIEALAGVKVEQSNQRIERKVRQGSQDGSFKPGTSFDGFIDPSFTEAAHKFVEGERKLLEQRMLSSSAPYSSMQSLRANPPKPLSAKKQAKLNAHIVYLDTMHLVDNIAMIESKLKKAVDKPLQAGKGMSVASAAKRQAEIVELLKEELAAAKVMYDLMQKQGKRPKQTVEKEQAAHDQDVKEAHDVVRAYETFINGQINAQSRGWHVKQIKLLRAMLKTKGALHFAEDGSQSHFAKRGSVTNVTAEQRAFIKERIAAHEANIEAIDDYLHADAIKEDAQRDAKLLAKWERLTNSESYKTAVAEQDKRRAAERAKPIVPRTKAAPISVVDEVAVRRRARMEKFQAERAAKLAEEKRLAAELDAMLAQPDIMELKYKRRRYSKAQKANHAMRIANMESELKVLEALQKKHLASLNAPVTQGQRDMLARRASELGIDVSDALYDDDLTFGDFQEEMAKLTKIRAESTVKTMAMTYKDGQVVDGRTLTMRPEFKHRSTLQLIESGHRTATTRAYNPNVTVGQMLKVGTWSDGSPAIVEVTSAPVRLHWADNENLDAINAEAWSRKEGWAPGSYLYFAKTGAWQFSYRPINLPAKPAPKTSKHLGKIETVERYTRADIQANPDKIYVFGDNIAERGYGGQAAEARGEPNAIGIPTKYFPTTAPNAYFGFSSKVEKDAITRAIDKLLVQQAQGKTIVMPKDGVGTGLSDLQRRAPDVWRHLQEQLGRLEGKPVRAPVTGSSRPEFDQLPQADGKTRMTYAGIGSRETPPEILAKMREWGKWLADHGYTLHSGHAIGADRAFEAGVPKGKPKAIFLDTDATEQTRAIALEIHPNPTALKAMGQRAVDVQARNTFQVFGANLDAPVDFVLCWTRDGAETHEERLASGRGSQKTGGTGQAISLAHLKGIPVINMNTPDWRERLIAAVSNTKTPAAGAQITPKAEVHAATTAEITASATTASRVLTAAELKAAKVELLASIDAAILEAPNLNRGAKWRKEHVAGENGFVTFDVEGDGKFKVVNHVDALKEFREKVSKNKGFGTSTKAAAKPKAKAAPRAPMKAAADPVAADLQGHNIYSKSLDNLARALTNVTYQSYQLQAVEGVPNKPTGTRLDAEMWYKANKATKGTAAEKLAADMETMRRVIMAKFKAYPELLQAVTARGGSEYLRASSHITESKAPSRWEGKGSDSNFIEVLAQAYEDSVYDSATSEGDSDSSGIVTQEEAKEQFERVMKIAGTVVVESSKRIARAMMAAGASAAEIAKETAKFASFVNSIRNTQASSRLLLQREQLTLHPDPKDPKWLVQEKIKAINILLKVRRNKLGALSGAQVQRAYETNHQSGNGRTSVAKAMHQFEFLHVLADTANEKKSSLMDAIVAMAGLPVSEDPDFDGASITSTEQYFLKQLIKNRKALDGTTLTLPRLVKGKLGRMRGDTPFFVYDAEFNPLANNVNIAPDGSAFTDQPTFIAGFGAYTNAHLYLSPFTVLVHEAVHASTTYAESQDAELAAELADILKQAQAGARSRGRKNYFYGLGDTQELMAEAASNAEFREYLDSIKSQTGLSLLDRIKNVILKALGMIKSVNNRTLLMDVLDITDRLQQRQATGADKKAFLDSTREYGAYVEKDVLEELAAWDKGTRGAMGGIGKPAEMLRFYGKKTWGTFTTPEAKEQAYFAMLFAKSQYYTPKPDGTDRPFITRSALHITDDGVRESIEDTWPAMLEMFVPSARATMSNEIHKALGRERGIPATHDSPYRFDMFNWRLHRLRGEGVAARGEGVYLSTDDGVHGFYLEQFSRVSPEGQPAVDAWNIFASDLDSKAMEAGGGRQAFHKLFPDAPINMNNATGMWKLQWWMPEKLGVEGRAMMLRYFNNILATAREELQVAEQANREATEASQRAVGAALADGGVYYVLSAQDFADSNQGNGGLSEAKQAERYQKYLDIEARDAGYRFAEYRDANTPEPAPRMSFSDIWDGASRKKPFTLPTASPIATRAVVDFAKVQEMESLLSEQHITNTTRISLTWNIDYSKEQLATVEKLSADTRLAALKQKATTYHVTLDAEPDELYHWSARFFQNSPEQQRKLKSVVQEAATMMRKAKEHFAALPYEVLTNLAKQDFDAYAYIGTALLDPNEMMGYEVGPYNEDIYRGLAFAYRMTELAAIPVPQAAGEIQAYSGLIQQALNKPRNEIAASNRMQEAGFVGHIVKDGSNKYDSVNYVVYDDTRLVQNFVEVFDKDVISGPADPAKPGRTKLLSYVDSLRQTAQPSIDKLTQLVAETLSNLGLTSKVKVEFVSKDAIGFGRLIKNKDGSYTIQLRETLRGANLISTLMHEVGHIIKWEAFDKLSATEQQEVLKAFHKWRKAQIIGVTPAIDTHNSRAPAARQQLHADAGLTTSRKLVTGDENYELLFDEWFADNAARYLTTNKANVSLVAKFFRGIARKLLELARAFGIKGEPDAAVRDFLASLKPTLASIAAAKLAASMYANVNPQFVPPGMTNAQAVGAVAATVAPGTRGSVMGIREIFRRLPAGAQNVLSRVVQRTAFYNKIRSLVSDPVLLKAMDTPEVGIEMRVAVAYELMRAGLLSPDAMQSGFRSMTDSIMKTLGLLTNTQFFEQFMTDVANGVAGRRAANYNIFARTASATHANIVGKVVATLEDYYHETVAPLAAKVFSEGIGDTLRYLRIPAAVALGLKFKVQTGERFQDDPGLIPARNRESNRLNTLFAKAVEGLDEIALDTIHDVMMGATQPSSLTPELRAVYDKLRDNFDSTLSYMRGAGMDVPRRKNYYPIVMSEAVETGKLHDEFIAFFAGNFDGHMRMKLLQIFRTSDQRMQMLLMDELLGPNKKTPEQIAEIFYRMALGRDDSQAVEWAQGRRPSFRYMNEQLMDFVLDTGTPAQLNEFAGFREENMAYVIHRYNEAAAKRAEFQRRFPEPESMEGYFTLARQQGATDADLQVMRNYVDVMMGTYGLEYPQALKSLLQGVDKLTGSKLADNPAMTRKIQGYLLVYQNLRLLALASLSSVTDPIGLAVRSGRFMDVFGAYRHTFFALRRGGRMSDAWLAAQDLGVVESTVTNEALAMAYGGQYLSRDARAVNDVFFQAIGLTRLTQATRVAGVTMAHRFLLRHARGAAAGNKTSIRYLEELGLKARDIVAQGDFVNLHTGNVDRDAKLRDALIRFVDEGILRPDASNRPLWMSDPNYQLFSQYKSFTYAFYSTVIKRMMHEVRQGNYQPLMLVLAYVPVMMLSELARELLKFGEEGDPRREHWGLDNYAWQATVRTGLLGPREYLTEAIHDPMRGSVPGASFLGPSTSQLRSWMSSKPMDRIVIEAMPLSSVAKYHIDTDTPPTVDEAISKQAPDVGVPQ